MENSQSEKPHNVKILQWVHLSIFLFTIALIVVVHNLPENKLEIFRVPQFLREIDQFLNFSWPSSLFIYQITLILFLTITFLNSLGLIFYSSLVWRIISDLASFLGLFVIWSAAFFLAFSLAVGYFSNSQNVQTALSFFIFALFLFILDLVTFFVDEQHLGHRFVKLRSIK